MDEKIIAGTVLNALSLEDSIKDFELIREHLLDAGYELGISHVEKESEYKLLLGSNKYDIILADFRLPGFDAFGALRAKNKISPNVPFICVSGSIGEETAVELLKLGAVDYVLKDRLQRLPFAIKRAVDGAKEKENRQKAENLLIENEKKYHSIFNNFTSVYFETSFDGTILEVSPYIEIVSKGEYKSHDLIGKQISDFYSIASERQTLLTTIQDRGSVTDYEIVFLNRNSSTVPCSISAKILFDDLGKPFKIVGIMSDITERKEAEETLRNSEALLRVMAENYPNSFVSIIEKDLTIGYSAGQEFKNQDLAPSQFVGLTLEQVFGEHAPVVKENYLKTFDGAETQFELVINDQYQFYRTVPLVNKAGIITRILTVVENITERKQTEKALKEKMNQMQQLHKLTVGRELNMIELKKEVNELLKKIGHEEKYIIVE